MTNEKRYATGARYRCSAGHVQELALYISALADPEREFPLTRVQNVLVRAMRRSGCIQS